MEKLNTSTNQITTKVVSNATGTNTYEIERTTSNPKGETAIIVLLYPTISSKKPFAEDMTLLHLTKHMNEMKLNRLIIVNLFSNVNEAKRQAKKQNNQEAIYRAEAIEMARENTKKKVDDMRNNLNK